MNRDKRWKRGLSRFLLTLVASMATCLSPQLSGAEETVGERFRKVLNDIDKRCRKDKIGPYLDPDDHEYRRKASITSCDILKLEPKDWRTAKTVKFESQGYPVPEQWLTTQEGRFAHSIRLPMAVGMPPDDTAEANGAALFQRLCDKYAGEYVLKRANRVDGLLQARPFIQYEREYRGLVFWTREKGDLGATPQNAFVQPPIGEYSFLDVFQAPSTTASTRLARFERGPATAATKQINAVTRDGQHVKVPYVVTQREVMESTARYAYTWRGVWLQHGLEHGIEGSELIFYQIQPFEVMAVRRDFTRHSPTAGQTDPRTTSAESCSTRKQMVVAPEFIRTVASSRPR